MPLTSPSLLPLSDFPRKARETPPSYRQSHFQSLSQLPTCRIQTISWKPRAVVYHNFLSDQEARHIIDLAHEQMKRSTVVGNKNEGVVDDIRTSYGTFLRRAQDPVIMAIEERLALWSHMPPSHQEDMQVLRYGRTNKYGPHIDGLERVATVLMYLVGESPGPDLAPVSACECMYAEQSNPSACAKGHVAYKPKRGDALMFFDVKPDYTTTDGHSMHTGCPVVAGVKWNAVKWIHGTPFRRMRRNKPPLPDPGVCTDLHEMCDTWARAGECQNNPGYMLGSNTGIGNCRLACKDCELCDQGDQACYQRNRESGGFLVFDEKELKGL
ncbi:hypothetical protein VOLCADRAFT_67269 [Volvox carteri f. nagariensis]|uniref:Fe2OG dioxygenase domain-containing protein n=1 Tax=Volvox carteri f. nagariensis TaxID=3068 RepID=D8UDA8_VOLCA|nr:uncharacterized protein VOLCADRAFT_67269 [Volvox carteri f. nagariensis]EFJ42276.1 hypothetical protein VOLCADRAFT_67269 [Volvox carteri f. nagariensis]|eukprot:XP_002956674.1 hypothetical protein VOLCADRAFT_67269 [Volvox carteri f. nagariensis]